ncbi:MAG TPA: hypothetical protein VI524_06240, partial [Anaerolineales bacterium]|nr:hypothetical protein [Anaerolineales bacterium]
MSPQTLSLILYLILAALHLPVLMILLSRRAGQERAAMWLTGYVLVALSLEVGEGLWRGGQLRLASPQVANDFQIFGAVVLAFLLTLTVVSFIRRDPSLWLGIGALWLVGLVAIVLNLFRFGEVIWTNGRLTLTLDRLAPTWGVLGWLVLMLGAFV